MRQKITALRRTTSAALLTLLAACGDAGVPNPASEIDPPAEAAARERDNVLVLGTSLSAGFGVGTDSAYPAVLQQIIDSAGLPFRVINAGLSGETSAGGLRRLEWSLQQGADVLILELGANDGLRGLDTRQLYDNLDSIIRTTLQSQPGADIIIAGMEAPPNMGPDYTRAFRRVYQDLARAHEATLIPFLLDSVAAIPALNQADGIHPTAEGHRIIARTVWRALEPVLQARRTASDPAAF